MSLEKEIVEIARTAKEASRKLAVCATKVKNDVLLDMASGLGRNIDKILSRNKIDIKNAEKNKVSKALVDRLVLNKDRIDEMRASLKEIAKLDDPVGRREEFKKRPNGLVIYKMRVPIGVIGIIYEARPNVTSDCIGLTLKSGNAVILRGGSTAINSNTAVYETLAGSIRKFGLPEGTASIISSTDRRAVNIMLKEARYIDLIIPRGGEGLITEVVKNSLIPVIKHYKGVCHVYVDEHADLNMAHKIAINAKVQRPGVCNAMETLLVHEGVAARFLPVLIKELIGLNVEIRGCKRTHDIAKCSKAIGKIKAACEDDWFEEYLDLILAVKVVSSLDEAIGHINKYGSMHSDAIVTDDKENAERFLKEVDSACVFWNASTRFTDGYQFGMGAEIGISTDKLHARGPMALEELTTYKYVVYGKGQIRQ